jgi:hypothetical protein
VAQVLVKDEVVEVAIIIQVAMRLAVATIEFDLN